MTLGISSLILAVNVSSSQFHIDGFEQHILDTVALHKIDARKLQLELTETVVISGMASVVAKMNRLRAAGITFALDDFGTGYSSLSYLQSMPIQQLKIDRSFVGQALETERGAALVSGIVKIGLDLSLIVLAEGVETAAQHGFLLNCGCHEFQGFYFSRPITRDAFQEYVQNAV